MTQRRGDAPPPSERREEILALAAEMFADRGYASTTVREIADAAGILSGSLYHHFDSKESMLDEIMRVYLDDIVSQYRRTVAENTDPLQKLRTLVHQAFGTLGHHRAALAVMLNEFAFLIQFPRFAYLMETADETERLWVEVIEKGMRAGVIRTGIEPRLLYRFMRDTIFVSVRWYRPNGRSTPAELADDYLDILLAGIAE